jgi:hypothetical protein
MTITQKTIKTETFTAVVTNPGVRGFSFKVTKGTATRRMVRRAVKRLIAKDLLAKPSIVKAVSANIKKNATIKK